MNWPGKREALLTANAPIAKTLRPCREESVDFDTTKNLFIEGDNLEALKLLQETYLGKVKMIYIDPPYNTGQDFIYEDDFKSTRKEHDELSGVVDEDNNLLFDEEKWRLNSSANGRYHSDWLSMIYPRLKLSKSLLKSDGAIFISINDIEMHTLRKICDEVFGAENFVTCLIWKARQIIDSRNKTRASTDHEYLLVYSKSIQHFQLRGKSIDTSKYSNSDEDPRGPWMSNSILGLANASQRPNLHFPITDPITGNSYDCPPDSGWRYSRETMAQKIAENRILFPKKIDGRPREKKYLFELNAKFTGLSSILPTEVGYTLHGSREVRDLMDGKYFDFPKPTSLLSFLIEQGASDEGDIILDFFAGSGTTIHSTYNLGVEQGINRQVILVQLPEVLEEKSEAYKAGYKTIAEITKERIRRAGQQALHGEYHENWNKDVGFRVLKIDTSNMADVYYRPDEIKQADLLETVSNIKEGRDIPEDLLFQVLLDWGVDLTLPIEKKSIQGKDVYFVDQNALAACFDTGVTEELVKEIAGHEPLRVVFKDNGFVSDAVKINVDQVFRQLSPSTEVKSI